MAHFMQALMQYFISHGEEEFKTHQFVLGNFLYAFVMRIYLLKNVHVHPMVATLFAKNILWKYDNVFKPTYNRRGVILRQQKKYIRPSKGKKRHWMRRELQNHLSLSGHLSNESNDLQAKVDHVVDTFFEQSRDYQSEESSGETFHEPESMRLFFKNQVKRNSKIGKMIEVGFMQKVKAHIKQVNQALVSQHKPKLDKKKALLDRLKRK